MRVFEGWAFLVLSIGWYGCSDSVTKRSKCGYVNRFANCPRRGRRDAERMSSKAGRHDAACMIAHKLIEKFSVIVGYCDLLIEKMEPNTEHARRMAVIREVADSAVKELVEHQHQVESEMQKAGKRKAG